jgi:uncharacterized protein YjdB
MRWFWRGMPLVHAVLLGSACGITDTDEPTPVDSVEVTPPSLQVAAGSTAALDAHVLDAAGNRLRDRRVVWASANPSIASVSDNGVVTGVAPGRIDVAATSEGKSGIASVTVVPVPPKVATVRIAPDRVNLVVAASASLAATPYDNRGAAIGGRTVVWTTNNAGVVAISQTGQVTGIVPGTAVITAVIDGVAGNATVVVAPVPVSRVVVSPSNVSINVGKSTTLTARLLDASGNALTGRTVTWASSDDRVATVDNSGVVRGIRKGSVVITATSEGKLGTANVRIE